MQTFIAPSRSFFYFSPPLPLFSPCISFYVSQLHIISLAHKSAHFETKSVQHLQLPSEDSLSLKVFRCKVSVSPG